MPTLSDVWLGLVTKDTEDSGTDSRAVLIVNERGVDVVHHTFPDTAQTDLERGRANLYTVGGVSVTPENITNSSVRLGLRGSDLWRPQLACVWGRSASNVDDIHPLAFASAITTVLSIDVDEGRTSLPIRRVARGTDAMSINRLLVVLATADIRHADTPDAVEMLVNHSDGTSNIYVIAGQQSSPARLERAEVDLFTLPVFAPFTRRDLRSITLRILGDDQWIVRSFFVFGLDDASGRPEVIVPLLHEPSLPAELFTLSTDEDEGVRAVEFQSILG